MTDYVILVVIISVVAIGSWALGWHFGATSLRNRHKRLIKLLEDYNENVKERNKTEGNNWHDGFTIGVSTTLTSFEMFLEKFKE